MSYRRRASIPPVQESRFLLRAVFTGWLVALVFGMVLVGLLSIVLLTTSATEEYLPYMINGLGFISILAGSMIAARRARSGRVRSPGDRRA